MANITPSQTIGPFFHEATRWLVRDTALPSGWTAVAGYVLDGDGKPVSDAMLEITLDGQPDDTRFQRVFSADDGGFRFHMPAASMAHITVFARGLLRHLFTRLYLDAARIPEAVPAARRATLLALREGDGYRWDLRLRGEGETVFFDLE